MKYFGTDGIRGIIDLELNKQLIKKIARGIVKFYNKHRFKKIILIGNDTRISSDYLSASLEEVLLSHGIEVHDLGSTSSPCLAYLTRFFNYPMSIMISASHNSADYNGIKFFNNNGEKISSQAEQEIESLMDGRLSTKKSYSSRRYTPQLCLAYINHLRRLINNEHPVIFDCANGACSHYIKTLFPRSKKINISPNGTNINLDSGCTHIEQLCIECRKYNMIGFAFDGDGDRVIMVDESGLIIDGDKILYLLSNFYLQNGENVVGTIYSNEGLQRSLKNKNISLIRTNVGDKNVYEKMCEINSNLGGEKSGHIIVKNHTNTGDGILTSILILNILKNSKLKVNKLLENYQEFHQEYSNIKLRNSHQFNYKNITTISSHSDSRIVIRPSGTEPVLRIMVENENEKIAKLLINELIEKVAKTSKNT